MSTSPPDAASSEVKTWTAPEAAAGMRLDLHVGQTLGVSRAKLKDLFDETRVRVGGKRAKKGDKVSAGDVIRVDLLVVAAEPVTADASTFELVLLYEDSEVVVVDKPAHRPSNALEPGETGTVANALVARFPECAQASLDPREGGLCHRLDVETSGVLLAARTRPAWEKLREDFTERRVDKKYWALVTGPIGDDGEIDLPLRHHPRHPDRVEPALDGSGREALSRFRVLARTGEISLVEVTILTGVLHQVRAHLAAIGAPLWGDARYGGREDAQLGRFFLHARSLGFAHPTSGKRHLVDSPLPPELKATLARVGLEIPRPTTLPSP